MTRIEGLIEASGMSISDDDLASATGSGTDAPFAFEPERSVRILAEALRSVHSVAGDSANGWRDVPAEPAVSLTGSVQQLVRTAKERLIAAEGQPELAQAYAHMSRSELVEVLEERSELIIGRCDAAVLNQGNPTLANLRFSGVNLLGFADWDRVCVADRHLDLALAVGEILSSMGAAAVREFLEFYSGDGEDQVRVDPVRLDWFSLAVELIR